MMLDDITLNGFYRHDPSILTNLDLPEGIDEEMLRFTILDNAGMMVPYHQVLPQLGISIHYWFTQNKDNFARILAVMTADYNPIENYDRMEDRTQGRTVDTANQSESTANNSTNTGSESTSTASRVADNADNFRNTTRDIGSATSEGTSSAESSGTSSENTKEDVIETSRIHGNVGVTTNQHMVREELDLRNYNIYEDICSRFIDKFLIGVYD